MRTTPAKILLPGLSFDHRESEIAPRVGLYRLDRCKPDCARPAAHGPFEARVRHIGAETGDVELNAKYLSESLCAGRKNG